MGGNQALVNRRTRLLVVERTGSGKSSVYLHRDRILRDRGRGPTLIVSPLLALMRNQIEAAGRLGIRALSINSTNRGDWPDLSRAILADEADAILISPERLANDEFVRTVLLPVARRIGLLVVDEVHCISDWGTTLAPTTGGWSMWHSRCLATCRSWARRRRQRTASWPTSRRSSAPSASSAAADP